jgi:hypothetical protein
VAGDYPGMIYLGMIDSGKKNIPLLMFLRRNRAAAEEGLIQQFNAGHAKNGKLAPVRQTAAAAFSCCLICKQVHNPFLNAIVLRLHDSFFTLIGKAQQASLMDGRQDELMNSRIDAGRRGVPYYMN